MSNSTSIRINFHGDYYINITTHLTTDTDTLIEYKRYMYIQFTLELSVSMCMKDVKTILQLLFHRFQTSLFVVTTHGEGLLK